MTLRETAKGFWYGQGIYFVHVIALITPGVEATQYEAHPIEPKSLDGWSSWDRALMIEEGRRQADRQLTDLKEVRGRAQWLFTVGIAVTADGPYFVTGTIPVERSDGQPFEPRPRMTLCRCGGSANKPLCDGSHKETGFRDS